MNKHLRKQKELQVKGLQNLGSTCYVSAVIQSLAACDHFKSFVGLCFQRYNPVDSNGRHIVNSKSQLFPLVAALHRACLFVNRQGRNDSNNPAPQIHILRVLSSLNYKLPRGSEQDSFELFEYIMSGIQEEMVKMVQESKGNDYACLIPNAEPEEAQLVEVVVEKIDGNLKVTSVGKSSDNAKMPLYPEPVVDAGGDKECKQMQTAVVHNTNSDELNIFETSQVPHVNHRLGYYHSAKRTILINPFIGSIASRLQCLSCLCQNPWNIEKFHGFSLPLPQSRTDRITLRDLIDNYLKMIIVHEVECDSCCEKNGVKTKSSFSKLTAIARLPKSLCFHIQRSSWGSTGSHKRSDFVVFNEILDLSTLQRFQDVVRSELLGVSQLPSNQKNVDVAKMYSSSPPPMRFFRSQYRLCSVISHCGATDSGHFITFRRGSIDKDTWFLTSDEDVLEVPVMAVFNSKAYMLFYELIEPSGTIFDG
ncbi:unnamed protein product [Allacma fusca]|uniref:Ubiquitin carboxyl-terminal hydrolase n=1 Tax=Allacma fusca TaxID=39272 RepID=A0A8J2J596_9HEXA|nr:unnamed protein product [Allacma fusca]